MKLLEQSKMKNINKLNNKVRVIVKNAKKDNIRNIIIMTSYLIILAIIGFAIQVV